jgi:hypothetical protein
LTNNHVLALGPYIGDFEQEILTFIPYMRWLSAVRQSSRVYLSTHFNRSFFYDWIPKENIFPVYEEFSRNEIQQHKYIHENVNQSDYTLILKLFKNQVQNIYPDEEIDSYYLSYSKNNKIHYPIYKKQFKKYNCGAEKEDFIVLIPDNRHCADELYQIYDSLINYYHVIVIGDMKTHLVDENIILQYPDYVENGYKYIMSYICRAQAVICPTSHWSVLANLQQVPLFTWGKNVSQFKKGGIYDFGNKCLALSTDDDIETEKIINSFKYFMDTIGG